jgi:hypothetical protein
MPLTVVPVPSTRPVSRRSVGSTKGFRPSCIASLSEAAGAEDENERSTALLLESLLLES